MSAPPETTTAATAAALEAPSEAEAATAPSTTNDEDEDIQYENYDDLDLPPLRIRATRQGDRLSASSLHIPPGIQNQLQNQLVSGASSNKRKDKAAASPTGVGSVTSSVAASRRGRSRSRSPSIRSQQRDANSSFSSLEEFVDPDILYDKMGFVELDQKNIKQQHHQHHNSFSGDTKFINLTPVSERMSEDTLEDVHAFSDLSVNTNTRSLASVGTGGSTVGGEVSSHVLEPLDEVDEDFESDDDSDYILPEDGAAQIILTNLENITLQDHDHHHASNNNNNNNLPPPAAGADAPSLPTA